MVDRVRKFALLTLLTGCVCASVGTATAVSATVETFGAEINQTPPDAGTCGFQNVSERPCVFVNNIILSQAGLTTAPCTGTITRFRLNGIPRPADHYALRVIHRNPDGSYTGSATSAPVSIATQGIDEYATSLPVSQGDSIGIDFEDSTEDHGLYLVNEPEGTSAVLFNFPADGTAAFASIPSTHFYYLFNADVECGIPSTRPPASNPLAPTPTPTPTVAAPAPSNVFGVIGLKKTTVSLSLASAGTVSVTEATATKKKSSAGAKAKPKLLYPSSVTGGPGTAQLKLSLTAAAKAKLREAGRVTVKTTLAFTPTGGTTAVQAHTFTVKQAKSRH